PAETRSGTIISVGDARDEFLERPFHEHAPVQVPNPIVRLVRRMDSVGSARLGREPAWHPIAAGGGSLGKPFATRSVHELDSLENSLPRPHPSFLAAGRVADTSPDEPTRHGDDHRR